jgi:hypothetical protein
MRGSEHQTARPKEEQAMNELRIRRVLGASILPVLCAGIAGAQKPPCIAVPAVKLLPTTRHAPDEFGTQDYTVTVISATSFTADAPYTTGYGSLFRFFPLDTVGHHSFAAVMIPAGVVTRAGAEEVPR